MFTLSEDLTQELQSKYFSYAYWQCFGSAFFYADLDTDPGKNLHADPDPEKMIFSSIFFHVLDDSRQCPKI